MKKLSPNTKTKPCLKSLRSTFEGRSCLVTGHTGFKGAWLCQWLREWGAKTTGYALPEPPSDPSLFHLAGVFECLVRDCRGDVRDANLLAGVVSDTEPEIIFHLAAQPLVRRSYAAPKETFDINIGGTVNLLEAARACPSVRAVVVITTDKCYENREWVHAYRESDPLGGHDPYSASKGATEIVASSYRRSFFDEKGVGLATARAGNVIGGGDWAEDRILPDAVRAIEAGQPIPVRNPGATRPWQHVLEPLFGYLTLAARLLDDTSLSGAWNFAPPTESSRSVRDVVETFLNAYGKGSWQDLSDEQDGAPHEAGLLTLAWDKAYHGLGWRPRWSFEEAITRAGAWYSRQAKGEDPRDLCRDEINAYMEKK